ncbi:hypothetical protein [Amphritea pacifica]|uniref:hypothetical protein n=1 Tax=Amphritea pacifica TaxID=2811233 RepID=UPI0019635F54|nr:hypothetical protein [Amphritea pacifica]MBN1008091.1 hypothetical protein [Amphritea pacifica]
MAGISVINKKSILYTFILLFLYTKYGCVFWCVALKTVCELPVAIIGKTQEDCNAVMAAVAERCTAVLTRPLVWPGFQKRIKPKGCFHNVDTMFLYFVDNNLYLDYFYNSLDKQSG